MTSIKLVMQTEFGETGNCMSACLASLFHLDISEVPNFHHGVDPNDYTESWWRNVRKWLHARGFGLTTCDYVDVWKPIIKDAYIIVNGPSPRGRMHSTIWLNGKMMHDPHPDNTGILKPESFDIIFPHSFGWIHD